MITNLTQIDVLRYVYNETSEKQDKEIHEAILTHETTADDFVALSEAKIILDKGMYSASERTLNNILNYSKSRIKESAQ
jgi:hypothetical protein